MSTMVSEGANFDINLVSFCAAERFSAVVGNPPYQSETSSQEFGQISVISIFQHFQKVALTLSTMTCMIYPGERWVHQSGLGMKDFGYDQLNSPNLSKIIFFSENNSPFGKDTFIQGGLTAVLHDQSRDNNGSWELVSKVGDSFVNSRVSLPGESMVSMNPLENALLTKVRAKCDPVSQRFLNEWVSGQWVFNLESNFVEWNPDLVVKCDDGFSNDPGDSFVKALINDKIGKGGRTMWFWVDEKNLPDYRRHQRVPSDPVTYRYRGIIRKWKVVCSSMNTTGRNGRTPNTEILDDRSVWGRSRVSLGVFDTREEALNFYNWAKTPFVRTLMATSGELLGSFAKNVPLPTDFLTHSESGLDYKESNTSLNDQLCALYELSENEKSFVNEFESGLAPFSRDGYDPNE